MTAGNTQGDPSRDLLTIKKKKKKKGRLLQEAAASRG